MTRAGLQIGDALGAIHVCRADTIVQYGALPRTRQIDLRSAHRARRDAPAHHRHTPPSTLSRSPSMEALTFEAGGVATGAGRARDSTARFLSICTLALATCVSLSALAHAQGSAASREARATTNRSTAMSELSTVGLPVATPATPAAAGDTSIRPFRARVSDDAIADLRRRLKTTRWPDKETAPDASQGAQLAKLQALVRYWGNGYDWRKAEAKLNALPQFTTSIDGVDIHFIHVRSRHPNAMPVVIAHGWPGSVFKQIKLIGPLTDPTAFGGRAEDAFDIVIPSLPGYGFSGRPTEA